MIGILIPTHNRCASLCRTLENLAHLELDGEEVRVFVVADSCSDDTVATLTTRYPTVHIVQRPGEELWWTGAINLGAERALAEGAEYLWVFNDDIAVEHRCLAELVKLARAVPGSIVGPKILELEEPQRIFSAGGEVDWIRSGAGTYMRATGTTDGPHLNSVRVVRWLPGMGMLIPGSVWLALGGMDAARFPQYLSDADLGLRATNQGIPVLMCPSARLFNDVASTAEQVPPLGKLWSRLGSPYFHGSLPNRLAFLWRHCPWYLLPYRVGWFYGWLLWRSLQRSRRERQF